MSKPAKTPWWLGLALAALLCGAGCGKLKSLMVRVVIWVGTELADTVMGDTLRQALGNFLFPRKVERPSSGPGGFQQGVVPDQFNPLHGRYKGELTLKNKRTGKQHTFTDIPVVRDSPTARWRICPEYREVIASFLE